MLTFCEKMPLIIRAGMIAMNNTAMLTSKYSMDLKFIVGNAATPFMPDVSFIVLSSVTVITLVCCQRLARSVCKVTLVISDN